MADFDDTAVQVIHPDAPGWANALDQRVRAHMVHMETRAAEDRRALRDKVIELETIQRGHGVKLDAVRERLEEHLVVSEPLMAQVVDREHGLFVRLKKVESDSANTKRLLERAHWYALGGLAVLTLLAGVWKISGAVILKVLAALQTATVTK
jgi:hypothetical protein